MDWKNIERDNIEQKNNNKLKWKHNGNVFAIQIADEQL